MLLCAYDTFPPWSPPPTTMDNQKNPGALRPGAGGKQVLADAGCLLGFNFLISLVN